MEKDIENLIEQMTLVRPEKLNEEALKLFNTIMAVLDERDKLIKGYRELEIENQSYKDYLGTPPVYEDAKYIPKSKIKEKIEEIIKNNPAQDEEWDGTDYQVTSEESFAIEILEDLLEE